MTEKTDAIGALLEHVDGESVEVYLPYRKKLLGGYAYGEIFAMQGDSPIFGRATLNRLP